VQALLTNILTNREQEIIRLRYSKGDATGLTCREIGYIFNSSEVAIHAELTAAVHKLRQVSVQNAASALVFRRMGVPMAGEIT